MSSTDLALQERQWIELMAPAVELAKHVADTAFVPKGLRGNGPAIVAAIMYGDEVGLGPMQALAKIAVIDGRPSLSAEAQRALILAAGHELWVVESTNTKVTVAGRRSNSEHTSTITWTLDDAKRAGLAGRQNWRTYPRQMLMARATAELARLIFADAVGGLLATEELEDGEGEGVDADAPFTKRKRRTVAQPETSGRVSDANGVVAELPPLPDESIEGLGVEPIAGVETGTDEPTAQTPSTPDEPGAPTSSALPSPAAEGSLAPQTGNTVAASTRDKPMTGAQRDKLGVYVGWLRDDVEEITTIDLYKWIAKRRGKDVPTLVDDTAYAYDEAGVLRWGPLLKTLTRGEANGLIDALVTKYGKAPTKETAA